MTDATTYTCLAVAALCSRSTAKTTLLNRVLIDWEVKRVIGVNVVCAAPIDDDAQRSRHTRKLRPAVPRLGVHTCKGLGLPPTSTRFGQPINQAVEERSP